MKKIHDRKNADYASDDNPYSNFEYSALLSKRFKDPVDKVFVVLISTKLARIAELSRRKKPKNESLDDSYRDVSVYSALWWSYNKVRGRKK